MLDRVSQVRQELLDQPRLEVASSHSNVQPTNIVRIAHV
jgi:hypothetical protein